MREFEANINGIDVSVTYSGAAVNYIFLPLLKKLTRRHIAKGKRILVMLAAPPGAGKSTLASFLAELSKESDDICSVQAIGIDGFHRRQEYLLSHTAERDGETVKMVDIKGAPITFDLEKLTEAVKRVAYGENCGWPAYDRILHNPVENAYYVESDIVILEGNYLLLDEDGWRDLEKYADFTIQILADENVLRERLIDRKIKSGNSREDAEHFVDYSDMANVRTCLEKTMSSDMILQALDEGDFTIV